MISTNSRAKKQKASQSATPETRHNLLPSTAAAGVVVAVWIVVAAVFGKQKRVTRCSLKKMKRAIHIQMLCSNNGRLPGKNKSCTPPTPSAPPLPNASAQHRYKTWRGKKMWQKTKRDTGITRGCGGGWGGRCPRRGCDREGVVTEKF